MNKVTVKLDTGYFDYPYVVVTYDGTNIGRFFKDEYLKKSVWDAIVDAKDDKDIYDFANFVFSAVNNAVKRHYRGQELMLLDVEVVNAEDERSVSISR